MATQTVAQPSLQPADSEDKHCEGPSDERIFDRLCWDASFVISRKGESEALNLLREAARRCNAVLCESTRTMHHNNEDGKGQWLGLGEPAVRWLRSQGVLVWRGPEGGVGAAGSRREARRLAKAEKGRDPEVREARRTRRRAAGGAQRQRAQRQRLEQSGSIVPFAACATALEMN
eukprot:scaffold197715_cov27-Prasinocladus_malaysianus.AAC.1